jgi:hypothetical protein
LDTANAYGARRIVKDKRSRQRNLCYFGGIHVENEWDKLIAAIERRKHQLDDVIAAYKQFREKLAALPPDLASEFMNTNHSPPASPSATMVATKDAAPLQDLDGKSALDCVMLILRERNNQPTHFSIIAKTALARGYKGRKTSGSPEELESRTIQSFWAAMSRSDELEGVGGGYYRIQPSFRELVKEAVDARLHVPFSVIAIAESLRDKYPKLRIDEIRPRVAQALQELSVLGEVMQLQKDTERQTAMYDKAPSDVDEEVHEGRQA